MDRLDKILAGTGRWSRREVKGLVRAGRVTVNGAVAGSPEQKYDRLGLDLRVDGAPIGAEKFVYLMLHKPGGVLSATEDPKQSTVVDLLPEYLRRVGLFPVGRLDKDTEGLLLLTNDGPLGHRLLAPGRHVDKVYFVRVEGTDTALVTLREGKYHQIKRMLACRGKPVRYLKRLSMGPLRLDEDLGPGEWRELTAGEIQALTSA